MGRPPKFKKGPMTNAERQRRWYKQHHPKRRRRGEHTAGDYDRADGDFYPEPPEAVRALLDHERFDGEILDPCCGVGTIPAVCRERGLEARGFDLADRAEGAYPCRDFFAFEERVMNVICNPPFKRNYYAEWAEHALSLAHAKVAIFARVGWRGSARRHAFFEKNPPTFMYLFASRVSVPPGGRGIERKGGKTDWAWFVFEPGYRGLTTVKALPPR